MTMSTKADRTENWSKDYIAELELTEARRQQFQKDGLMTSADQMQEWIEAKRTNPKAEWPKTKPIK